jgi:hypothetical protein
MELDTGYLILDAGSVRVEFGMRGLNIEQETLI